MLTNVDRILEMLRTSRTLAVSDIAQKLGIAQSAVMNAAESMEEEGIIKIEYKFMKAYLVFVRDKVEDLDDEEESFPELKDYSQLDQVEAAPPERKPLETTDPAPLSPELPIEPKLPITPEKPLVMEEHKMSDTQGFDQPSSTDAELDEKYDEGGHIPIDIPEETDQEDVDDIYPVQEGEASEAAQPAEDLGDLDQINALISTANQMIDSGNVRDINQIYKQIYDRYTGSISLSIAEKEVLKSRIFSLFSRIKALYA